MTYEFEKNRTGCDRSPLTINLSKQQHQRIRETILKLNCSASAFVRGLLNAYWQHEQDKEKAGE